MIRNHEINYKFSLVAEARSLLGLPENAPPSDDAIRRKRAYFVSLLAEVKAKGVAEALLDDWRLAAGIDRHEEWDYNFIVLHSLKDYFELGLKVCCISAALDPLDCQFGHLLYAPEWPWDTPMKVSPPSYTTCLTFDPYPVSMSGLRGNRYLRSYWVRKS